MPANLVSTNLVVGTRMGWMHPGGVFTKEYHYVDHTILIAKGN